MRFATACIVILALASQGSVSAQAITFGRRISPPTQPSFQVRGFNSSISSPPFSRARLQGIDLAATSSSVGFHARPLFTCPMPVAHIDSANDPMSVAGGGPTEPMPVARSGCWNPLDPSH